MHHSSQNYLQSEMQAEILSPDEIAMKSHGYIRSESSAFFFKIHTILVNIHDVI